MPDAHPPVTPSRPEAAEAAMPPVRGARVTGKTTDYAAFGLRIRTGARTAAILPPTGHGRRPPPGLGVRPRRGRGA